MNTNLLNAVTEYAKEFHSSLKREEGRSVAASPLASWLLLASIAVEADYSNLPEIKTEIESVLRMPLDEVKEALLEVFSIEELNYVSKSWYDPELASKFPKVLKWVEQNDLIENKSSIPSQKEVDKWVDDNTRGLIKQLPVEITPDLFFLVVNIIYSKLTWRIPFSVIPASEVMEEQWDVKTVLTTNQQYSFYEYNNVVYVHVRVQAKNKEIVSLTLPLEEVDETTLLNVAYELNRDYRSLKTVNYKKVPQKEGLFTVKQRVGETPVAYSAVLPAWDIKSELDLGESPEFGFQSLFLALTSDKDAGKEAELLVKQSVVVKFTKEGFEAAAVTAFGIMRATSFKPVGGVQDVLTVMFSKPFAFISSIDSLPVFSGIVRTAVEGE